MKLVQKILSILTNLEWIVDTLATDNIERPGAWLKTAIEQGWKPNESGAGKIEIRYL